VTQTAGFGATIVLHGDMFDDAYAKARELALENGYVFVHPFDDPQIIAGAGTVGIEMLEEAPDLDTIVVPIGGGGLMSGVSIAARALKPGIELIGVEAELYPSMKCAIEGCHMPLGGDTLAEGIAVKHPGELTMAILDELLDDIVHVDDDAITEAITLLLERSKLVVEGAGAASVAALLHGVADGEKVCALLSGGNIDATLLVSVVRHGLTRAGRYLVLRTRVPDRPGGLVKLLELVAEERGNLLEVNHRREGFGLDVAETGVELTIITRNDEHCRALVAALEEHGYAIESVNRRSV